MTLGVQLGGALVAASYAVPRRALLKRLGDVGVPRLIEPETIRFSGSNFQETAKLMPLPYAPKRRIPALNSESADASVLALGSLDFAQAVGTDV